MWRNFSRNGREMQPELFYSHGATGRKLFSENICKIGGADFWIFWIFNRWQPAADVKCYSKTKVEKAFFFISCQSLRK
jgi:hypothetical protein